MTLNDLLCRFTGEADITVLDPDTPRAGTYLSGEGALIPAKLRDRKVLRFTIDTETLDHENFVPLLVVYLKGSGAA